MLVSAERQCAPVAYYHLPNLMSNPKRTRSSLPSKGRIHNMKYNIKPLNLEGGQCIWCGKYGHQRRCCPLLK